MTTVGSHLVSRYGTLGVLAGMTLESAGVPLPSEVIMPLGALGARGAGGVAAVVVAGTAGNLLGSWIAYGIGALIGVEWRGSRVLQRRHWEAAHAWFERYGGRAVFFGRVLPVVRTYISFPAGAAAMPAGRFTLYTLAGSAIWSAVLAVAGYELGAHWRDIQPWFDRYAAVALLALVLGILLWWRTGARRRRAGEG